MILVMLYKMKTNNWPKIRPSAVPDTHSTWSALAWRCDI